MINQLLTFRPSSASRLWVNCHPIWLRHDALETLKVQAVYIGPFEGVKLRSNLMIEGYSAL